MSTQVSDAAPGPSGPPPWVEALELFVELLSQSDQSTGAETSGEGFYDRMCEAVCRLTRMERAIIFRYDSATRRVRAAGAHGIDIQRFAGQHVSVETLPITADALAADQVIEAAGDLSPYAPPQFQPLLDKPRRLVCAPMAAAGMAVGVILADRPFDSPPVRDTERDLLWTLGKTAALASVARIVVTQAENAKQLRQRIDLAREVHEGVIQRLFGVSMALDGEGDLPAETRTRCASETQVAMADLRSVLQRPLGRPPRSTRTTLMAEVERLAAAHPELGIVLSAGEPAEVPEALEPLAQSILTEAVRNAQKHAHPTFVQVGVSRVDGALVLDVVNDGVIASRRRPGMGLRLAAFEALQSGGVVEFGERAVDGARVWQVRLVVPVES